MDDGLPKLWYRQDVLLQEPPVEVDLDMGATPRVCVTPDHTLVLHNVTSADTAVYHCLKFSFLLDGKLSPCLLLPVSVMIVWTYDVGITLVQYNDTCISRFVGFFISRIMKSHKPNRILTFHFPF
jgi:hypothetical protein